MRWNGVSRFEFVRESMETETTTWSEISNVGKAIVEQILVPEEINKSKRAVRVTVRDLSRKISHLSKVICNRKIIKEFTRSSAQPE